MCLFGNHSDQVLLYLIYAQFLTMILAGSLLIANLKIGGGLMALSMFLLILSRDNPILGSSDAAWRSNF